MYILLNYDGSCSLTYIEQKDDLSLPFFNPPLVHFKSKLKRFYLKNGLTTRNLCFTNGDNKLITTTQCHK